MKILGRYAEIDIKTENIEEEALKQLYNIASCSAVEGSIIKIMPDVHAGKGVTIGYTQRLNKSDVRICPNFLGVDLGCRISSIKLPTIQNLDFEKIDKWIRENIPLGAGGYIANGLPKSYQSMISKKELELFDNANKLIEEDGNPKYNMKVSILNQLISIGSGNHFIAINQDKEGCYWLSIHCGSRNFGLVVANIYQNKAIEYCNDKCDKDVKFLDSSSPYLQHYLECVHACQKFSEINHRLLTFMISKFLCEEFSNNKKHVTDEYITTIHNYLDLDNMIIRKGAISAQKDEKLLIPFNMRDGIAVGVGKGNEDYNFSAPHGAGRIMSRSKAKQVLDLNKVKEDMKNANVFTTSLDYALDEAADAYKNKEEIIEYIKPTVDISDVMKEVYNIKGK